MFVIGMDIYVMLMDVVGLVDECLDEVEGKSIVFLIMGEGEWE